MARSSAFVPLKVYATTSACKKSAVGNSSGGQSNWRYSPSLTTSRVTPFPTSSTRGPRRMVCAQLD